MIKIILIIYYCKFLQINLEGFASSSSIFFMLAYSITRHILAIPCKVSNPKCYCICMMRLSTVCEKDFRKLYLIIIHIIPYHVCNCPYINIVYQNREKGLFKLFQLECSRSFKLVSWYYRDCLALPSSIHLHSCLFVLH